METGTSHVLFISQSQVIYAHVENGAVGHVIHKPVRFFPGLSSARHEIVDVVMQIVGGIPRQMLSAKTLVLIYGSPWSHAGILSSSATRDVHTTSVRSFISSLLKNTHNQTKIHGAHYSSEKGMLATSAHPLGYVINGHLTDSLPTGKLAAADALCAVDWIDESLHKQILAALFPWYIQATSFLICSVQGALLSKYITELNSSYDGVVIIGANSSVVARHKIGSPDIVQYSLPLGFVGTTERSEFTTSDSITDEYVKNYQSALVTGLDTLFPEVLVAPKLLVMYEPHIVAHELAQKIISSDLPHQSITPRWTLATEFSEKQWLETFLSYIMVS